MPDNLTINADHTLHDKWSNRYRDIQHRIQEIKGKINTENDVTDPLLMDNEIQELYIQGNLIHQFLKDMEQTEDDQHLKQTTSRKSRGDQSI